MKTTIKQTIEVEVDIQLPYYFKNICYAYAIFDEDVVIQVNYASSISITDYSFMIEHVLVETQDEKSVVISETEFKEIYSDVLSKINILIK